MCTNGRKKEKPFLSSTFVLNITVLCYITTQNYIRNVYELKKLFIITILDGHTQTLN